MRYISFYNIAFLQPTIKFIFCWIQKMTFCEKWIQMWPPFLMFFHLGTFTFKMFHKIHDIMGFINLHNIRFLQQASRFIFNRTQKMAFWKVNTLVITISNVLSFERSILTLRCYMKVIIPWDSPMNHGIYKFLWHTLFSWSYRHAFPIFQLVKFDVLKLSQLHLGDDVASGMERRGEKGKWLKRMMRVFTFLHWDPMISWDLAQKK